MLKTHKKFKTDNYIITLDKNSRIDVENLIKEGVIIKLSN